MKIFRTLAYSIVVITFVSILPNGLHAQGTGITYQGHALANGAPMNGAANFTFTLYTNSQGGSSLAGPVTNLSVPVTNGLFTAQIDFGSGIYTGASSGGYWLEIGVQGNGDTNFGTLSPRQQLTPTAFAVTAENLSSVTAFNSVYTSGFATIAGGLSNSAAAYASAILGGQYNTDTGQYGTIGGGTSNTNSGNTGTIAGGLYNANTGGIGTIGGGYANTNSGSYGTIGGGNANTNLGIYGTIGGGYDLNPA